MPGGTKRKQRATTKRTSGEIEIESSSGNVFADLGVPHPEEMLARAELALRIGRIISRRKLTQAQAAEVLGVDQPKVSALLRGKLQGFSSDRLFRFLNALGSEVEIIVRPAKNGRQPAQTRVRQAS